MIGIWKDAYTALSRARVLEIVGYSMPPDDIDGAQRNSPEVLIEIPHP
jgi:hypothetical protein